MWLELFNILLISLYLITFIAIIIDSFGYSYKTLSSSSKSINCLCELIIFQVGLNFFHFRLDSIGYYYLNNRFVTVVIKDITICFIKLRKSRDILPIEICWYFLDSV